MSSSDTSGNLEWLGGDYGAASRCVLAPNAGPMTLDGTNTWVLRAGPGKPSVVVDPGPDDPEHRLRVAEAAQDGGSVSLVLLTHGHLDHSEGARAFADLVGCEVRALDPAWVYGGEGLRAGEKLSVAGLEVHVVPTPGHTADSLSFYLPQEQAVLTGDTVLGRGTTVVAHPDGKLGAYLDSLDRLRNLAEEHAIKEVWPGHGPVLHDALAVLDRYVTHRHQRLAQVRAVAAVLITPGGSGDPIRARDVVEAVYADIDEVLWGAAELSVRAQLEYLGVATQPAD